MSSTLALAKLLQQKSVAEIELLLAGLRSSTANLNDLFDLAKLLLSRRELERRIRALPADQLQQLRQGVARRELVNTFLAAAEVFPEAAELALELEPLEPPKLTSPGGPLACYEMLLSITEILYALEQHWFETTKNGIKARDAKTIAEKFHLPAKQVQLHFDLAMRANLVLEHHGRWAMSPAGRNWLSLNRQEAWLVLASSVWDLPDVHLGRESIVDSLSGQFPLLDLATLDFLRFGAELGLLAEGEPVFELGGIELAKLATKVVERLPSPEDRLIVQSDLSIICPGPVSSKLHGALDSFADSEELGLASRFRISALSVSHFLETGGSISAIAQTLEQYSSKELPQPVQYLLADAERKFGQLRIIPGRPTLIACRDAILLTQISNERSLAHLRLQRTGAGLTTNASVELCYFSLRAASYAAVMTNQAGEILSPRLEQIESREVSDSQELSLRAQALIESEAAGGVGGDVRRVLQFALKNRLAVTIDFEGSGGAQQHVRMIPLGVTESRVRGRETEREAELTLPLSRISTASLD